MGLGIELGTRRGSVFPFTRDTTWEKGECSDTITVAIGCTIDITSIEVPPLKSNVSVVYMFPGRDDGGSVAHYLPPAVLCSYSQVLPPGTTHTR